MYLSHMNHPDLAQPTLSEACPVTGVAGDGHDRDPLLFAILETARALHDRLEEALKEIGLSGAKFEALSQLARAGEPVPLRVLAEGKGCVPSNMTTLVDRLESDGLVRRVDDPADRRSKRAVLTPLGEERAAAGAATLARLQEAFAASVSPADRATLLRVLATLRAR